MLSTVVVLKMTSDSRQPLHSDKASVAPFSRMLNTVVVFNIPCDPPPTPSTSQNSPPKGKKIDKRGRKLVDYDSQRHSFQALQTNMKKRDEAKITKGREQLEEAKRTYEILNSELHDELPALYDSRILFLVTNLQSLFNSENVFHSESAKVFGELEAIVDKLATDSQRGSYSVKKTNGSSLPRPTSIHKNTPELIINNASPANSARGIYGFVFILTTSRNPPPKNNIPPSSPDDAPPALNSAEKHSPPPSPDRASASPSPAAPAAAAPKTVELNGTTTPDGKKSPSPEPAAADKQAINNDNKHVEELYDIPVGASTENLPPGVLYRVKATYKYNREDVDELSFEVGEIISVVEYDDPEEQEEGWLMGIKDNGDKGMFPANFTRPL
ncbi:hypothetical protein NQ318_019275 [Aromia moschata]|uniref:Endophilin-A n=1 Tax=Aromia moschata TaxID=1265417 RepID=A0AAV8Z0J3_9CUCU|nr:hypothetical protein NQ318_019275 [Aromia moschata]